MISITEENPTVAKSKLRFRVNLAEAFRRGIGISKPVATIEVDPATLPEEYRVLIADRMDGQNVYSIDPATGQWERRSESESAPGSSEVGSEYQLITANGNTFEDLMEAVALNAGEAIKAKRERESKA